MFHYPRKYEVFILPFSGVSYTEFSLRAGSSIRGYGGQVRSVSGYVQHPNFNSTTLDMDYAVMSVSSPFVFGTGVQPILLKDTETPVGTRLTVTGWGTTVVSFLHYNFFIDHFSKIFF